MLAAPLVALAKSRPPIEWGPIFDLLPPEDDASRRRDYDRAAEAAKARKLDELVELSARPWQPPSWEPGRELLELTDFKQAGLALIQAGRKSEAYRLGTTLLESEGTLIHALVGLFLRKRSNAGPRVFPLETFRSVVRSEFTRWIVPSTAHRVSHDPIDSVGLPGWWRAREASLRLVWGGAPGAFDRRETLNGLLTARDWFLSGEPDEAECMRRSLSEGAWLPVEMLWPITPPWASVRFAISGPAFRYRRNGYGRFLVAATYSHFAKFIEVYDQCRKLGDGRE